jgi:glycosyltransferase involved in cell wall biosynthesis
VGIEHGRPLRIAYTIEQSWHPVPGGTAIAALRIARELSEMTDDVELAFVAGRHPHVPDVAYRPTAPVAMLPLARPWLYEAWTRLRWPKLESVTGEIDVAHATGLVPAASNAPLVVTVHDLAFLHDPDQFTKHGAALMRRSLKVITTTADRVICSSEATMHDCAAAGIAQDRLRHVPLGVDIAEVTDHDVDRVRRHYRLPEAFILFVGTLEPRKNLARLVEAVGRSATLPLVVAGMAGWGDQQVLAASDALLLGFVPDGDLAPLYAAASVFAYPSEREGFGLPVLEAMAQGTPVVTSRATSTEEVAGGAAVLVDPFDVDSIAAGLDVALERNVELEHRGRTRARELTWRKSAERTLAVYRELAG